MELSNLTKPLLLIMLITPFLGCDFLGVPEFDISSNLDQEPLVLLLKSRQDVYSEEVSNEVVQALTYTKVPHQTSDLSLISEDFEIPPSIRVIVISSYLISELSKEELDQVTRFVAKGNTLVFLGTVTYDNMAFLQGIRPFADYTSDSTSNGMYFYDNVFPEFKGNAFKAVKETPHKGITKDQFHSKVNIYASASNDPNYPLIIGNKIGLGEVITVNSSALSKKLYRGLIFSTILKGLEGIPYSVANVSTIFLDDFPAPLYNRKLAPIDSEYDVTHAEFVSKIWWPDMQAFADTFDIEYSAMTAFNYNANVVPPFDFSEWEAGTISINGEEVEGSKYLGKNIQSSRHELAYHGYNHFSLWLEDWDNVNFMASSVLAARKKWRNDGLGRLPVTYVPPTNYIDSLGISAILKGMPSIRYMSSLYLGDIKDGGDREFGPEPYASNRLFNYPRVSSGFTMKENSLTDQQSMELVTGIWNHFIHPDDVFQVNQRNEDGFESRNPLELGWKSHPTYKYGLYHLLRKRILFTKKRYPLTRFLSAENGGKLVEDWTNLYVSVTERDSTITVMSEFKPNYVTKSDISNEKHWFTYVTDPNIDLFIDALNAQEISFDSSRIWNGVLMQYASELDSISVPNLKKSYQLDASVLEQEIAKNLKNSIQYQTELNEEFSLLFPEQVYVDTRLEDAIRVYSKNPDDFKAQENLINLSIEFGDILRGITILERKMLTSPLWLEKDIQRLFMFYGWEKLSNQAENFLERLWLAYPIKEVIDVKNYAVSELGLTGVAFETQWFERERELNPNDEEIILRYTRSLENESNWPWIKQELRRLIVLNPFSDSLYAYSLQRSFYFEKTDSITAFVEEFPSRVHPQLDVFANNLALYYAYDLNNYPRALYWANRDPDFDEKIKLDFLSQLNLYGEYQSLSDSLIASSPSDDSLKTRVGTQLYYEGFKDKALEVMYPLFENSIGEGNTSSHKLMNTEISFMSYSDRKKLYKRYPAFFSKKEYDRFYKDYRWFEGTKFSAYGEYQEDNFNNIFARFGTSIELGNRRDATHTFKIEDLYIERSNFNAPSNTNNFIGPGYEFSKKSTDQSLQFKTGGLLFYGVKKILPEIFASLSYSYDSTFTSGSISFGPELTNTAIESNIFYINPQLYREDIWLNDFLVTSLSASGKYYTDSVLEYEIFGRVYLQPIKEKVRIRPIGELSWADASINYLSGTPYFTPDNFFSKGIGLEFRLRRPDNFDYLSLFQVEIMGKHETNDGFFGTGRIQLEHKFKKFWEFKIGSDISTSKTYSSNRFFFSFSYYFKPKPSLEKIKLLRNQNY